MTKKRMLERIGLWSATVIAGTGALGFGINALTTLNKHAQNTGELYGMATASAVCMFVFSYFRGVIRDRREDARNVALPLAVAQPALRGAAPDWGPTHVHEPAVERVERDCPYCAERILVAAKLCKHCHSDVSGA